MPAIRKAEVAASSPNVVNGINVTDLFALIESVKREPATGMTNWRVTTMWQGQTHSRSQVDAFGIGGQQVPRRFSIDIDEPSELGGGNAFANPQEHLLAALNPMLHRLLTAHRVEQTRREVRFAILQLRMRRVDCGDPPPELAAGFGIAPVYPCAKQLRQR